MNAIIPISEGENRRLLIPDTVTDKDGKSRLGKFVTWLNETKRKWSAPDLAAYRDELLERGLSPATVQAHLSTIRGRYNDLLNSNAVRIALYDQTGADEAPANRKAFVDEMLARLSNDTDPKAARVKTRTIQDKADSEHLRLTQQQAETLMNAPGVDTLKGLRDTALITLALCTGLREAELCALTVGDLMERKEGSLAVLVREGKGCKQRLVPYGALEAALGYVEAWLTNAGISAGPVFRGFYKDNKHVRPTALTPRAVQMILGEYPLSIDEEKVYVKPHDLRRTYARRLHDAGMTIAAIQQNLGHADMKTTLGYIGDLAAEQRKPPAVYRLNLARLSQSKGA